MTYKELIKILKKNGCYLIRHGSNHDMWKSPKTGKQFSLPRHAKEAANGTVKNILKDAGIE